MEGGDPCPAQLQSESLAWDPRDFTTLNCKLGKLNYSSSEE